MMKTYGLTASNAVVRAGERRTRASIELVLVIQIEGVSAGAMRGWCIGMAPSSQATKSGGGQPLSNPYKAPPAPPGACPRRPCRMAE